jgi:circadian clock protein KaiC
MQGIKEGENGVFVTVEEMPEKITSDAMNFGWDLKRLEAEKKLRLFHLRSEMLQSGGAPIMQCLDAVSSIGARRIVVDPISLYSLNVGSATDLRRELYAFVNYMKENGLTLILTHEVPDIITRVSRISDYGLEFIVDCIIMLQYVEIESEIRRSISVLKMRGSDHDKAIRRYRITGRGVEIESRFEGYEGIMSGTARKTGAQAFIEAFKR